MRYLDYPLQLEMNCSIEPISKSHTTIYKFRFFLENEKVKIERERERESRKKRYTDYKRSII